MTILDPVFLQTDVERGSGIGTGGGLLHGRGVGQGDVPVGAAVLQHLHMDVGPYESHTQHFHLVAPQALDVDGGGERTDACQADAFEGSAVAHGHVRNLHGQVRKALQQGDVPVAPVHLRVQVGVHLVLHGLLDAVLEQDGHQDGRGQHQHHEGDHCDEEPLEEFAHGIERCAFSVQRSKRASRPGCGPRCCSRWHHRSRSPRCGTCPAAGRSHKRCRSRRDRGPAS